MLGKKLKQKKCRECNDDFTPWNSTQVCCCATCAIDYIKRKQEAGLQRDIKRFKQIESKEIRQRKEKLKSRSDHLREAQIACNAYIRERDKNKPCISCGTTKPDIQYAAGHYKTRGSHPALRFHPFNLNKQCNKNCNLHLSGNIAEYRPRLIEKIGLDNVEWLEGPHQAQNWSIDDIKEIKAFYKEQLKIIKT